MIINVARVKMFLMTKKKIKLNNKVRKILTSLPAKTWQKIKQINLKKAGFFLIIIALLVGFYFKKDWLIVAVVDKQPIWRWQFNNTLSRQYGQSTLKQLIDQKLINKAIKTTGIQASEKEIEEKITETEKNLGGLTLEEALKMQDISQKEFKKQIENQIKIEKFLGEGIEITDDEISAFIEENSQYFETIDKADQESEASENILKQKMNEKYQEWYQELLDNAAIIRFFE